MTQHVSYRPAPSVSAAVDTRRSIRAYQSTKVPQDILETLLQRAARAPSGTNMQPWKTYVLTGEHRRLLCDTVCDAFDDEQTPASSEVNYYPDRWFEPYLSRRRQVGWSLYGLLGIKKGDREATRAQQRRNYQFFDAPVGLIFTVHRGLATGSWLDYGMFLQNIMLLAREQGLHTCPQAAWADFHPQVRRVLPMTEDEVVVCGMALGYAETEAVENSLVTQRVALDEHVTFLE